MNVKNDALKLAKEMMDADQNKVDSIQEKADATASKEKEAQTSLDAEKAKLNKSEGMNIPNPTFTIPSNVYNGFSADVLKSAGVSSNVVTFAQLVKLDDATTNESIKKDLRRIILQASANIVKQSNANVKYDNADLNRPVDINNLTDAQKLEISEFYVNGLKQIRNAFKNSFNVQSETATTKEAVALASRQVDKYEKRGLDPIVHGHVANAVENIGPTRSNISNMYELKQAVYNELVGSTYLDKFTTADENYPWGHLYANLNFAKYVGIDVANINGRHYMITTFSNEGTPVSKSNELAQLEAKLAEAQKQNSQAQTALTNAKAELAEASRKYASALEAKTDAEKELASKTASPLQTEVAEKNLQLANLALKNAQERKATAEEAVENFSRSQAEKQTALETAKAELATAKTAQKDAETALTSAQAKLQAEENKLTALQAEQAKLHEEKDKLVSDAKAIATELSAYLNADKNLADAQAKVADLETKLTQAKSAAKLAQDKLDAVTAKLQAEQAKLAEIQEEFDKLVKAERKDYYNLSGWSMEYLAGKQTDKKTDTELKKVEDAKPSQDGNWIQSAGRWWYKHADGSYTTNGWEQIKGTWYYFDHAGWMQTGWVKDNGTWYYLNNSGSMATGWVKDNGIWYYLNNSGSLVTGWIKDNGSWYYLDKSGAMTTGWFTVSGKWYYAYSSGALAVNPTTPDGYRVNYNGEWVG